MDHQLRAVCDRYILDVANLRFLAACVPNPGPERKVPATGWTIRQTFFHIAAATASYAKAVDRHNSGDRSDSEGEPEDVRNARQIAETGTVPLNEILDRLAEARDSFLAALAIAGSGPPVEDEQIIRMLHEWSRHASGHALEMLEALGTLRFDPFLLNWLAGCELPEGEVHTERRDRLVSDARAYYDSIAGQGDA